MIDTPGRFRYHRKTIQGLAQADVAVLVIRADEMKEWTEQTKEHALLAQGYGIRQLVVVLNASDDGPRMLSTDIATDTLTMLTKLGFNSKLI